MLLKFLDLKIGNLNIERIGLIKFLGVMYDEHTIWKDEIRTVVTKIANNIGLLHPARQQT